MIESFIKAIRLEQTSNELVTGHRIGVRGWLYDFGTPHKSACPIGQFQSELGSASLVNIRTSKHNIY